ncbi:MAG: hypothetical protein IKJ98_04625 [Bacteroidales bacterium]|nr:hypothetical protein [Bacteroidales bacterium]
MKVKRLLDNLLVLTIPTLFFLSCTKEKFPPQQEKQMKNIGVIKLGKQIDDPYRLENMQRAYNNLYGELLKTELQATHKYVRFLPKNEEELDLLKNDTSIVLYDYPLDYEISEGEGTYHDEEIPDTCITWQYTVVPYYYIFPNITNELIYEVFIPEEDNGELKNCNLYDIEEEAFRLTGNVDTENDIQLKASRWHPSGNISVWDDVFNQCIPLEGAKVQTRWSTNIKTCKTDANGNFYQSHGFLYKVNYAIKWEGGDFDIRDGLTGQAWYNGPKQKSSWYLEIKSGKSLRFATIYRAAYKFYYGDNKGLKSLNGLQREKICFQDKAGDHRAAWHWDHGTEIPYIPDIIIYGKTSLGNYYVTNRIFGSTIHELGHRSHLEFMGLIKFQTTSDFVCESWAEAVEWTLTNDEYQAIARKLGNERYYNYTHVIGNHESNWTYLWETEDHKKYIYSPIFIDLIDDVNQRYYGVSENGTKFLRAQNDNLPDDRVNGYTLSFIQNLILPNAYGLSSLKESIRNHRKLGVLDSDLEALLSSY